MFNPYENLRRQAVLRESRESERIRTDPGLNEWRKRAAVREAMLRLDTQPSGDPSDPRDAVPDADDR